MINIPDIFTSKDFFDYIFNDLNIDVSVYVEARYHHHKYFSILSDIFSQIKDNL